ALAERFAVHIVIPRLELDVADDFNYSAIELREFIERVWNSKDSLEVHTEAIELLNMSYAKLRISMRVRESTLHLARVIAMFEKMNIVTDDHIAEALQYRPQWNN